MGACSCVGRRRQPALYGRSDHFAEAAALCASIDSCHIGARSPARAEARSCACRQRCLGGGGGGGGGSDDGSGTCTMLELRSSHPASSSACNFEPERLPVL